MSRVIFQVPIESELRQKAQSVALSQGFSSLQEVVRVLLAKLARNEMTVTVSEPEERISPAQARRYDKMVRDIKSGKAKTFSFTNVDKMMDFLNA